MDRKTRTLEELVTLQDQAIEALKQALAATQLALECLQKNRNEKGYAIPMDFPSVPYSNPVIIPNPMPNTTGPFIQPQVQPWGTPQWGNGNWSIAGQAGSKLVGMTSLVPTAGLCETATLDSQYANTQQTLQNAQMTHDLAVAYISSFQKGSDELLFSTGAAQQVDSQHVQGSS